MSKFNALILPGGGLNGFYQLSVMEELIKAGYKFDYAAGSSTGAINAALYATDQIPRGIEMYKRIINEGLGVISEQKYADFPKGEIVMKTKALFKKAISNGAWKSIFNQNRLIERIEENLSDIDGLASNEPLRLLLNEFFKISDFKIPCEFETVELQEGRGVTFSVDQFDSDVQLNNAILASTTMPGIWSPVKEVITRSKVFTSLVDGGIRNISPLSCAVNHISNHPSDNKDWTVFIINCSTKYVEPSYQRPTLINIIKRSLLDIALNEILIDDTKGFLLINKILDTFNKTSLLVDKRLVTNFNTVEFTPSRPLGQPLDASPDQLRLRYFLGKQTYENTQI